MNVDEFDRLLEEFNKSYQGNNMILKKKLT